MKEVYMHEVTFSPLTVETMGVRAVNVLYVSTDKETDIFKAASEAVKLINDGAKVTSKVIMTGYIMTGTLSGDDWKDKDGNS